MDEKIIQRLIYIVVIAVILLVNFAARNRKKKIQAEQQKHISQEKDMETPTPPSNNNTKSVETKGKEIFPPIGLDEIKTITSNNIQMSDTYIKKASRMESNNQSRMTKLKTKQITTLEVEEEAFKFSHNELKKAIIYSEIIAKREF